MPRRQPRPVSPAETEILRRGRRFRRRPAWPAVATAVLLAAVAVPAAVFPTAQAAPPASPPAETIAIEYNAWLKAISLRDGKLKYTWATVKPGMHPAKNADAYDWHEFIKSLTASELQLFTKWIDNHRVFSLPRRLRKLQPPVQATPSRLVVSRGDNRYQVNLAARAVPEKLANAVAALEAVSQQIREHAGDQPATRPGKGTTVPENAPAWVKAALAATPGWEIERFDAAPSVAVGERKGFRFTLRKGQKEYLDLEPRQQGSYSREELRNAKFVMQYRHLEVIVFQGGELPAGGLKKIGWTEWEDELPYFKKVVHLGRGMGMNWYANATIFDQEQLRQALKLKGGDDRLALLADATLVQDRGTFTRGSCLHLLTAAGDKAIPYIKSAVEQKKDGWKAIYVLSFIQTDAATDYLRKLYQADATRSSAARALVRQPFRKAAKEQYLDMLRRRMRIFGAARACVEFGWKEAIPLLNDVYVEPHSPGEFEAAFQAKRALEGKPVPDDLRQAQQELRTSAHSSEPMDQKALDRARTILLTSRDSEAATVIAIRLALFIAKASGDRVQAVRKVGREVLQQLPRKQTKEIVRRLANSLQAHSSYEDTAKELLTILSQLAAMPESRAPVRAADPAAPAKTHPGEAGNPEQDRRIAGLIARLGAEDHEEREKAQQELIKIGPAAMAALQATGGDLDPERAVRARQALRELRKKHSRISLYLLAKPDQPKGSLADLILQDEPLLTEEDFTGYDPQRNVLRLADAAQRRLAIRPGYPGLAELFVVVVEGKRWYRGALWTQMTKVLVSDTRKPPVVTYVDAHRAALGKVAVVTPALTADTDPAIRKRLECLAPRPEAPESQPAGELEEREARGRIQAGGRLAAADADARDRFLAIERIARLPAPERAKVLARLYRELAPRYMNPFIEAILSVAPGDILNRRPANGSGGNTAPWADQLADAALELSPEQVADRLENRVWLNVAARARAIQVFKTHAEATEALIRQDLKSGKRAEVQRASNTILSLELRTFTKELLALFEAGNETSSPAGRALTFLRDPAIVRPLLERVAKDPNFLIRCAGMLQGPLWRKPAEPLLLKLLDSPEAGIRYAAARAVCECRDPKLAGPAAKFAGEKEPRFRIMAARLASNLPEEAFGRARKDLLPLLDDREEGVRLQALRCFAQRKDLAAGPVILDLLLRDHAGPGGQREVTVMQALQSLAGKHFGYDMHHWGPGTPGNEHAIAQFEDWMKARGARKEP